MANNKQKDKTLRVFSVIAIFLCVAAAAYGFIFNARRDGNFLIDKKNTVHISAAAQILELGAAAHNNEIILDSDIFINSPDFHIGEGKYPFKGTFDGNGHTVRFNYAQATSATSFFSYLAPGAIVKNVHFSFDNIAVDGTSFGGIAKINDGTIKNCKMSFNFIELSSAGMFSPFVTINRGTISNVLIEGGVLADLTAKEENELFYGSACVYNYGVLKNTVVAAQYSSIRCTDQLKILKGEAENFGISAVRFNDTEGGKTQNAVAIIPGGVFTCDKMSGIEFSTADKVFTAAKIFNELDFNNQFWRIDGQSLTLITAGEN